MIDVLAKIHNVDIFQVYRQFRHKYKIRGTNIYIYIYFDTNGTLEPYTIIEIFVQSLI